MRNKLRQLVQHSSDKCGVHGERPDPGERCGLDAHGGCKQDEEHTNVCRRFRRPADNVLNRTMNPSTSASSTAIVIDAMLRTWHRAPTSISALPPIEPSTKASENAQRDDCRNVLASYQIMTEMHSRSGHIGSEQVINSEIADDIDEAGDKCQQQGHRDFHLVVTRD